jgi:hypothetical protein
MGPARAAAVDQLHRLLVEKRFHEAGQHPRHPLAVAPRQEVRARAEPVVRPHEGERQAALAMVRQHVALEQLLGRGIAPAGVDRGAQHQRRLVLALLDRSGWA